MFFKKLWSKLAVIISIFWATQTLAFSIYGFIPYSSRIENGKIIKGKPAESWFTDLGILPIHLVYEQKLLDYPEGEGKKQFATINNEKIQQVAITADRHKVVLVSLDLEGWNRFDAATPGLLLRTLQIFRQANPDAMVGLYATVPQNTYGWRADQRHKYDSLNAKYTAVADAVDYFSPSLYNYSADDFASWREAARYNIAAARKYSRTKKIFPYITPEVSDNGATRWLTYDEMAQRLQTLQSLGVDGCIVWASSSSRDVSGAQPVLNPQYGWLKALVDVGLHSSKP